MIQGLLILTCPTTDFEKEKIDINLVIMKLQKVTMIIYMNLFLITSLNLEYNMLLLLYYD
jgi:hypothetical protein